jgi:hypothetical protein
LVVAIQISPKLSCITDCTLGEISPSAMET